MLFLVYQATRFFNKLVEPHEEPRPLSVVFPVCVFFCPFVALPRNSAINILNSYCIHKRLFFYLNLFWKFISKRID